MGQPDIESLKQQFEKKKNSLEEYQEDSDDDEEFEMEDGVDMQEMLQLYFMDSKKNRNVCDILLEIKRQFEVQNKILLNISEKLAP